MSAASIAADIEGVGSQPVSAQTIRRTQSKDDAQESLQTVC